MASLRSGFRFIHGLVGLIGGVLLFLTAGFVRQLIGLGGGESVFWTFLLVLAFGILVLSPLWYWVLRPIYVWKFGEREAPWFCPLGTASENRAVRWSAMLGWSIIGILIVVLVVGSVFGGGGSGTGENSGLVVGETASHEGMNVTVVEHERAQRLTGVYGEDQTTPAPGAEFLLIHLRASNVGGTKNELPTTGIGGFGSDIELMYKQEKAEVVSMNQNFTRNENSYVDYAERTEELDEEIYPDQSVEGWIVFEVPADSSREEVDIEVRVPAEDSETFTWSLIDG